MQLDDERILKEKDERSRSYIERQCVVVTRLDISNCVIIHTFFTMTIINEHKHSAIGKKQKKISC
jgi:hypothetical protein